jgi:hypothetical protein
MPRGVAVRGFGSVRDSAALTLVETSLIAAWADGGAPEGAGEFRPPDVRAAPRPDLLLPLQPRIQAPAGEIVVMRTTPIRATRPWWVTGWRFYPNDPAIVQAEFALSDGRLLGSWTPPDEVVLLPAAAGVPLAGGPIVVSLHYRSARLQQDFPAPLPARPPVLALFTTRVAPPRELVVSEFGCADTVVGLTGEIVAVRPMATRLGDRIGVAVAAADRAPVPILAVRDTAPDHEPTFWLRQPVAVGSDTRLLVDSPARDCHLRLSVLVS